MGFISEFKAFAMRGNVMDMAVGIIIGAAFGKIVSSLVENVIMPPIGMALGGTNFADLFIWMGDGPKPESLAAAKETGEPFIGWGSFVQTTLDFLIVALAIFIMIKIVNNTMSRFEKKKEEAPKAPPKEEVLLTEIRDQLVQLNGKA